jgi:O-antigen ligase
MHTINNRLSLARTNNQLSLARTTYWLSLAMIGLMPWMDMVHLPGLGTVSRVVGLGVAALWAVGVLFTGKARKPEPFHLLALLFLLWISATVFWSRDVDRSWDRMFMYIRMVGLSLVIWDLYNSQKMIRAALQAYVLGSYVHAASVIYNFGMGAESVYGRFAGAGNIANTTAYVLGMAIPLAWYLATAPQLPGTQPTGTFTRLFRWVNLAYFPVALLAIALTATRFGIVMAVPACLYGLIMLLRARGNLSFVILMMLVGALWFLSTFVPSSSLARLAEIDDSIRAGDLTGRVTLWKSAWAVWENQPFVGIGIDAFPSVNRSGKVVHNTFLVILTETGLFGLVFYLLLLLRVFAAGWRLPQWESLFWLTVLVVWGVASLVLNLAEDKTIWLLFSLLIANARIAQARRQTEDRAGIALLSINAPALPLLSS